jgi:hypothetical protein
MNKPYLEITYRQGKPFAAYLYLRRRWDEKAASTKQYTTFLVDFAVDGHPIGIEFTRMNAVDLAQINQVLSEAHEPTLMSGDLAPLTAA